MLLRLWDEFFIKGQKVLFRVSLAMLYCMKDDLKKTRDFCKLLFFKIFSFRGHIWNNRVISEKFRRSRNLDSSCKYEKV